MMDRAEREALAIDIARRVRTIAVQPIPHEFLDALAPNSVISQALYTKYGRDDCRVQMRVDGAGSLELEFTMNNRRVLLARFDSDREWKAALSDTDG